jgi:hypothetical protein
MKPETCLNVEYRFPLLFLFLPGLILFCSSINAQNIADSDFTSERTGKIEVTSIQVQGLFLPLKVLHTGTVQELVSPNKSGNDRMKIFLDSLKYKASKTLLTKKLYDFVVTPVRSSSNRTITSSSDKTFYGYIGKTIRNIEIQRLDVFGTGIYASSAKVPNRIEKFLNNTHINTNESIVRKNIIFSKGDTISPLTLSDNERLLRGLPFIDDARIILVPVSEEQVDVIVMTKDVYSLGAKVSPGNFEKGAVSVFDKNIFGMGHEFGIEVPFDAKYSDSPGLGVHYTINNLKRTFTNLNLFYTDGLGRKTYGFDLTRKFVSAVTKYAGGVSVREMFTYDNLDTMAMPAKVSYNLQDYWLSRSFLLNKQSVSRLIVGTRYTNNNVFNHPFILPDSYYDLQKYKIFLGSISYSVQKFYKTNLVYGYGRTEDLPYGGLLNLTFGWEINEFKRRTYYGASLSVGKSVRQIGYLYGSAGFDTFLNNNKTEQGLLTLSADFISNLSYIGRYRIRNFINADYTRGFDRYSDEFLYLNNENGFYGFRNDSVGGAQRLSVHLESVVFSPVNFYGFRFAIFGFADMGFLFGTNEYVTNADFLSAVGLGLRIRNDNLILNTLQIRLGFYPELPLYSSVNHVMISGEQLLRPKSFEPGPPALLPFR